MKLKTFFDKFDQFADAPNAVAKMRRFILDLAVRGRLIAQDPSDEPAERLMERIKSEGTRLVKGGKLAKLGNYGPITENARPYDIPDSWAWVPLGNLAFIRTGKLDANASSPDGQYPFFTCARDPLRIDRYAYDGECVLLAGNGNFDVNYYDGKFEAYQRTYIIEGLSGELVSGGYLYRFTQVYADTLREMSVGGVISYIKIGFLTDAPFPLPPLAEQKRIVAKVDELMALCDRLEAQQQERQTRHAALARASLARFADAPTPANLDFLFHPSYTIDPADLRKTILTLAVQGKLVPQDPNDEPAETLNSKLPNRLRAIADKVGARFSSSIALVGDGDDLPAGWGVAAIQSIGITQTGTTPSKSESSFMGRDIPFIKPGDIQGDEIDYENEGLSVEGLGAGRLIPKNSVLMVSIGGSIGKTAIVD